MYYAFVIMLFCLGHIMYYYCFFCLGSDLAVMPYTSSKSADISTIASDCDIGKLFDSNISIDKLNRDDKYRILTREPSDDASSYPRTRASETEHFRQFQPSWLKSYPWLHYSPHVDSAFCRACVILGPEVVGGQSLGQFVTKEFRSWKKTDKLADHAKREYHLTCMAKMKEFITRYQESSAAIDTVIQVAARKSMKENLQVIQSLFKVILLCGKQGLAPRGHRDDRIDWDDREDANNEGNFIELVCFWGLKQMRL